MPKAIPEAAETRHPKKVAFLAAYGQTGIISAAAKAADVERHTPREWIKSDPEFRRAFKQAREQAADMMEAEALRRATRGVEEGVWHAGKRVGVERKYSDTLLIFLLKAARPKKYRENQRIEHSGPNGKPIQIEAKAVANRLLENPAVMGKLEEAEKLLGD